MDDDYDGCGLPLWRCDCGGRDWRKTCKCGAEFLGLHGEELCDKCGEEELLALAREMGRKCAAAWEEKVLRILRGEENA